MIDVAQNGTSDNDTSYIIPSTETPEKSSELSMPDIPVCIQYTLLVWLPCGFMLLVAPFYFYVLRTSKTSVIKRNWLNITKLVS